ncbi:hypothetical protein MUB24_08935 [Lederbergia sp. NSJ-179]|uniref:hypothetical protein n=1 Tax=Lederbergia sp. NSJ-179 TaxID=2931402 RepID=UPI001FD1B65A|nr:hypothetical protein [Lederbergia sp. NSJ-179]MCJ7841024.1 hypothetical protein [Lederbergia sp. NSJ-179]
MLLLILGIVVLILSVIIGFFTGSFWLFLLVILGGIVLASILFALASLHNRQEIILYHLQLQRELLRKQFGIALKKCPNCQYEFDAELSSCPRCGSRKA